MILGGLTAVAIAQQLGDGMKQLPRSTRPRIEIPGLKASDIVSVSEAKGKAGQKPTRIFRYTFRASYLALIATFKKQLSADQGWKSDIVDIHETDFYRDLRTGPVAMQGVLIFDTRLRQSKWAKSGWTPAPPGRGLGWVWVSYNERMR